MPFSIQVTTVLLLAALGSTTQAQITTSGEIGSTNLRQSGLPESLVLVAGASHAARFPKMSYGGDLLVGVGDSHVRTGRAAASMSVFSEPFGRSGFEASMLANVFSSSAQSPVTSIQLSFRQSRQLFRGGYYWGVSSGAKLWEGTNYPGATALLGSWKERKRDYFSAALAFTAITPDRLAPKQYGYTEFADVVGSWRHTSGISTINLSAGARFGYGNVTGRPRWMEVSVVRAVNKMVLLSFSGGRTPTDIIRGIPESRYLSASARITRLRELVPGPIPPR